MIAVRGLLLSLLWLAACTPAGNIYQDEKGKTAPDIVWPSAPEPPKIRFVREFSRAGDIGIQKSFTRKLADFFTGGEEKRMTRPYAVAVDEDMVVVADPGVAGVHIFDTSNNRYRLLDRAGKIPLQSPIAVALGDGVLFVADSKSGAVYALGKRFDVLFKLDDLQRPTGLAYDPRKSHLYVTDTLAHRVRVYDLEGRHLFDIGKRGEGVAQFNFPTHISLAGGYLLVNDTMNFRVQVFDLEGNYVRAFGKHGTGSGYFAQSKGVALDSDGHVYVADALADRIQIFSAEGVFLLGFGAPGGNAGAFRMPAGVAVWNDLIYVADSYNRRIQVFQYLGQEG